MANPLALAAPQQHRLSKQDLVDRGNAYLVEIGRINDVRWFLQEGRVCIGWVR